MPAAAAAALCVAWPDAFTEVAARRRNCRSWTCPASASVSGTARPLLQGARRVASELVKLPTHGLLTDRDLDRLTRWLAAV